MERRENFERTVMCVSDQVKHIQIQQNLVEYLVQAGRCVGRFHTYSCEQGAYLIRYMRDVDHKYQNSSTKVRRKQLHFRIFHSFLN